MHTNERTNTHAHKHAHTHTHTHTHMYAHTHMCTCTCTHTHAHTRTYTHTRTQLTHMSLTWITMTTLVESWQMRAVHSSWVRLHMYVLCIVIAPLVCLWTLVCGAQSHDYGIGVAGSQVLYVVKHHAGLCIPNIIITITWKQSAMSSQD